MFKKIKNWLFPRKEPKTIKTKPTIKLSPYQQVMVRKIQKEKQRKINTPVV